LGQSADGAESLNSNSWVGAFLRPSGKDGAEGNVVDRFGFRGAHLVRVMGGEADYGLVADHQTRIGGKKVVLSEMEACVEETSVIGAIVHDKKCRCVVAAAWTGLKPRCSSVAVSTMG
jgi:hypothetical protein